MQVRIRRLVGLLVLALLALPAAALAQGPCADRLPTERITLNLRDANVQTTLRLLAQQYRVNMVVTDEVKGTITLDFYQVPARDIFQVVIDAANLQCVEVGGVLRVSSFSRLRAEDEERRNAAAERGRREAEAAKKQVEADRDRDDFEKVKARGAVKEKHYPPLLRECGGGGQDHPRHPRPAAGRCAAARGAHSRRVPAAAPHQYPVHAAASAHLALRVHRPGLAPGRGPGQGPHRAGLQAHQFDVHPLLRATTSSGSRS